MSENEKTNAPKAPETKAAAKAPVKKSPKAPKTKAAKPKKPEPENKGRKYNAAAAVGFVLVQVSESKTIDVKELAGSLELSEPQSRRLLSKMVKARLLRRTMRRNEKKAAIFVYVPGNHPVYKNL